MRAIVWLACVLLPLAGRGESLLVVDFDAAEDAQKFAARVNGEAERRKTPPAISGKQLYLLQSWWKSSAAVGFAAPTQEPCQSIDVAWTLTMNTGTEGLGFVWSPLAENPDELMPPDFSRWEAPNLAGSFAVGFDAANPPNRDPFRGSGNVYDRPQHEVSLHWDGMEIVKRTTPMDFRDEKPHDVNVNVKFVTGGALIDVSIDHTPIYESYFIAGLQPYPGRALFGARNDRTAGDVMLDNLRVSCGPPTAVHPAPQTIIAMDHQLNDVHHPKFETEVEFPENTDQFGRILCTLRLDKPESRFDPWDRIAHLFIYAPDGERFELVRYVTPYDRGHAWHVDVSDFRPLLRGKRKFEQLCSTQGEGWVVTVTFDFYPGPAERKAFKVVNLWSGAPEIGNPDSPANDFYQPRIVPLDDSPHSAKVRLTVTGHGMEPNWKNAGEFMPIWRTLTVNGESFRNRLWKTDNYLNPCRPQGGTWKYDRAGWAPGDIVRPWEVDITKQVVGADALQIQYTLDDYVNKNRGQTWAPTHVTESQLILYHEALSP